MPLRKKYYDTFQNHSIRVKLINIQSALESIIVLGGFVLERFTTNC